MRITCGVGVGLVMRIIRACSVCVQGWWREVTPLSVHILCDCGGGGVMLCVCYVVGYVGVCGVYVSRYGREVTPLGVPEHTLLEKRDFSNTNAIFF